MLPLVSGLIRGALKDLGTSESDRYGVDQVRPDIDVFWISVNDDRSRHLRVNGTKVGIGPGLSECIGKLFVGVSHLGFEYAVGAHDGVRNVIAVGPSDSRSDRHGKSLRTKAKVIDFHLDMRSRRLIVGRDLHGSG